MRAVGWTPQLRRYTQWRLGRFTPYRKVAAVVDEVDGRRVELLGLSTRHPPDAVVEALSFTRHTPPTLWYRRTRPASLPVLSRTDTVSGGRTWAIQPAGVTSHCRGRLCTTPGNVSPPHGSPFRQG